MRQKLKKNKLGMVLTQIIAATRLRDKIELKYGR